MQRLKRLKDAKCFSSSALHQSEFVRLIENYNKTFHVVNMFVSAQKYKASHKLHSHGRFGPNKGHNGQKHGAVWHVDEEAAAVACATDPSIYPDHWLLIGFWSSGWGWGLLGRVMHVAEVRYHKWRNGSFGEINKPTEIISEMTSELIKCCETVEPHQQGRCSNLFSCTVSCRQLG